MRCGLAYATQVALTKEKVGGPQGIPQRNSDWYQTSGERHYSVCDRLFGGEKNYIQECG